MRSNATCLVLAAVPVAFGALGVGCGSRSELIIERATEDASAQVAAPLLAAGRSHACVRRGDGRVLCFGTGAGRGTVGAAPSAPNEVTGLGSVVALSAGPEDTCAVAQDGRVLCWGTHALAFRAPRPSSLASATPVVIDGLAPARSIAVGPRTLCAALRGGAVRCWGENHGGMLGIGTFDEAEGIQTPAALAGVVRVTAGYEAMGALAADGSASRWGAWLYPPPRGRVSQLVPDRVADLPVVTEVSMGAGSLCALGADGAVWCLGYNGRGMLGDGSTADSTSPVRVRGLPPVRALSVGFEHACAIATDGTVWCWGATGDGRAGVTTPPAITQPTQVAGVTDAVAIAAGWVFTCAAVTSGEVLCWGDVSAGTNGTGPAGMDHVPRVVGGL